MAMNKKNHGFEREEKLRGVVELIRLSNSEEIVEILRDKNVFRDMVDTNNNNNQNSGV